MDNVITIRYTERNGKWEKNISHNGNPVYSKGFLPLEEFPELVTELDKNFKEHTFESQL